MPRKQRRVLNNNYVYFAAMGEVHAKAQVKAKAQLRLIAFQSYQNIDEVCTHCRDAKLVILEQNTGHTKCQEAVEPLNGK